jgi:hypothetical protein
MVDIVGINSKKKPEQFGLGKIVKTLLITAVGTTPLMMVMMNPFMMHQLRFDENWNCIQKPGRADFYSLWSAILFFAVTVFRGTRKNKNPKASPRHNNSRKLDLLLFLCPIVLALMFYVVAMGLGKPQNVVATQEVLCSLGPH